MMVFAMVMMSPWFAWAGLIALSIPIWMHLYQRVASRRMPVSSLRLVPETPQVARSRRRIQHWPLFLLRALGVILLGLIFARPSPPLETQSEEGGREAVVIVLDRSGSMAMKSPEGKSAWDEALEKVQSRLGKMHPQSRVSLVCFPGVSKESDDNWESPSALRKTVADLTPSLAEGRPLEAMREASEILARFRSDMPESLEVVSDLQQEGWEEIGSLTLPEELRVRVTQLGNPEAANRGLALQVRGRDQLRRGAVVTIGGGVPLTVRDESEGSEVEEREITFPEEVVELPYRAANKGWVRREVTIQQPSDGLTEDDTLYDAFYVTPEIPVYLLEPHPERETFLQTTFFLHQALRPSAGQAAEDSRFLPQMIPVKDAAQSLVTIDLQDAVVVVPALANFPEGLPDALSKIVEAGGAVVFFAGPDLSPGDYVASLNDLLPAVPGEILSLDRRLKLLPVSDSHPIWGGLSESARRNLRMLDLKKRFSLVVDESAEVIASYSDDVPLVITRPVGKGRTLFVNASADRAQSWGDWPTDGALFVPTIHSLMSSVVTSTTQLLRNSPGSGIVGIPFDVRVDPMLAGVSLQTEKGQSLKVSDQGWVRGLQFEEPGLFQIQTADGDFLRPIAVNFPQSESKREFVLPAILQRQIESRRRVGGKEGESAAPKINLATESMWWRWILCALIAVMLAEAFLAFRPSKNSRSERKIES